MFAAREDELLLKLQQCIGKSSPKNHLRPAKNQLHQPNSNKRKSFDHKYLFFNDKTIQTNPILKEHDLNRKYKEKKDNFLQQQYQISQKKNQKYGKQLERYSINEKKHPTEFNLRQNQQKQDNHQPYSLKSGHYEQNFHKTILYNNIQAIQNQSYQIYKQNKEADNKFQKMKQFLSNSKDVMKEHELKRNYDKSPEFMYLQGQDRKQGSILKRDIKEDYERSTLTQLKHKREIESLFSHNFLKRQNLIKKNVKNHQNSKSIKTNIQALDDSFEMNSFQHNDDQKRKREDKNLRNQNKEKVDSVRRQLEEISQSENTFYKLQKIGELNQRINNKIRRIFETFEEPCIY